MMKNFLVNIALDGPQKKLSNYQVLLTREDEAIKFNAEEFLSLVPGNCAKSECGCFTIEMKTLDKIELVNGDHVDTFSGFHCFRESVRKMLKIEGLSYQLEALNRKLAVNEFELYMQTYGEYRGFSHYFRERFPEAVKKKYRYDISCMFFAFRDEFQRDYVPKKVSVIYRSEWRTRERDNGDYYHYPIQIPYRSEEPTYKTKAMICTIQELELKRYMA